MQDGMRKLVEDVRQPVSKAVSFYNRSHASTAPAKSFNAFEYSDKNLDKAVLQVQSPILPSRPSKGRCKAPPGAHRCRGA